MDPVLNPFSPGLSMPPPVLAGRDAALDAVRRLCRRRLAGHAEPGLCFSGLLGSGRSALLHALDPLARAEGCRVQWLFPEDGGLDAALAAAQAGSGPPALILADDVHALAPAALGRLLQQQERWMAAGAPFSLVLAGLPLSTLLDDAGAKRLERCFLSVELGPLEAADVRRALDAAGALWEPGAEGDVLRQSKGWPVHVQACAAAAWDRAAGPPIRREDVRLAADAALARLDRDFYGPGYERLSPREKAFLRTMAHLGPGPHRSGDIADSMDAKITSLGPLRAKLLAKGWVYSPAHGMLGFTAPGFDEYMLRVMPGFR